MSDGIATYTEYPHTVFDVLERAVFKDPGDGLGPIDLLDGRLRQQIIKALNRNLDAMLYCLKRLGDHEVSKAKGQAWSSRALRYAEQQAEAPSIGHVLVLLGIATQRDTTKMLCFFKDDFRIEFCDWAIACAKGRGGETEVTDYRVDDWHRGGSEERSRLPIEFDL